MAKARPIPGLRAEDAYGTAAARILAVRSGELADHSDGVLDMGDIERLHDMRVATRRLRAALEVFEACFPRRLHRAALREVKELADALGQRRDRDVAIAALEAFGAELSAPDRPGVMSLVENLRVEQLEANAALRPYVTAERVAGLRERLRELISRAEEAAGQPAGSAIEAAALARESSGNGSGTLP